MQRHTLMKLCLYMIVSVSMIVLTYENENEEVKVLVTQLCLTLFDPMDCSPPGSSVHGILQARILEWVAVPSPISLTYT